MEIQPRLTEDERANLVAFLDGELDDELAEKLEYKVARSVSVRKEIDALEKTWSMLDWLPCPKLPADFATQTVSRIHSQQLRAVMIEGQVKFWSMLALKAIGWVICVTAIAMGGFVGVRYVWPDPSRGLIEHLAIVEDLDVYRVIPDIKFIEDIGRIGLFQEPEEQGTANPATENASETGDGRPLAASQPLHREARP